MAITEEKQKLKKQQSSHEGTKRRPSQHAGDLDITNDGAEAVVSLVTDGFLLPNLGISSDEAQPPAYGERHDNIQFSQPGFDAGAAVTDDGRININLRTENRRLADLLAPTIDSQISASPALPPAYIPPGLGAEPGQSPPPVLNVVVQIVGSRGDVQPFVALGKVLKDTYGHRIRIATHATFRAFVEENGLEFFNIGGNPAELMAFMVKHPGLMPGIDALKSGEVSKRRRDIEQMLLGCWRSCIEAGDGMGPPPKPHRVNATLDLPAAMPGDGNAQPFVADAIIANPPSFAHLHVAEKLGIPLHMMFTMPWSPTRAFPHPLANVQSSNADDVMTNYMTYTLVEMMTWQGLGDIINRFREKALDLPALSFIWAPGSLNRLKIPYTYCWSPALIPKPNDWGKHIDVSGFFFLDLAPSYIPDPELEAFLEAGPPPVYIGFGSIVVENPDAMTRIIFDAIHLAGVRALVSKGWGGLGADDVEIPETVFMLGNVPHDWLFEHVSAVVHHGGAGTTAAGIKAGKPTVVVPFFGDQPFWGAMIARANAGPEPIRYKHLTAQKLSEAIKTCLDPNIQERATFLGNKIRQEAGTDVGARSFHRHMDVDTMRCSLAPSRVATWRVRRTKVRLSPLAMSVLVNAGILEYKDVKLCRHIEYITEDQPPGPITAGAASLIGDLSGIGLAIADVPRGLFQARRSKACQVSETSAVANSLGKQNTANSDLLPQTESTYTDVSNIALRGNETSTLMTSYSNQSRPDLPSELESSKQSLTDSTPGATPVKDTIAVNSRTQLRSQSKTRSLVNKAQSPDSRRGLSPRDVSLAATVAAGQSVGRVVSTGVRSPMNFCLGLAKGFRNMPRLYNDDTVRPIEKVTDLNSGIKIAGKELGFGLFDGIVGMVTQPMRGVEKGGASGLVKGIGKGIGGLIAKPAAGMWGLPAYIMQGIHAEVNKFFSKSVTNYIITSRIVQGNQDREIAGEEEKADIITRWNSMKSDLNNFHALKLHKRTAEKTAGAAIPSNKPEASIFHVLNSWHHTRNSPEMKDNALAQKKRVVGDSNGSSATQRLSDDVEYERAIQASVRETSRGNEAEDVMIEAAIRESVNAMRARNATLDPLRKASELTEEDHGICHDEAYQISDEEYQELIEKAIQQSLASHVIDLHPDQDSRIVATSTSACAAALVPGSTEKGLQADEGVKRATEDSRNSKYLPYEDDEAGLQQAIEASKQEMDRQQSQKHEEDVVLEYIKKQSILEQEHRQKMRRDFALGGQNGGGDDDDEELKSAFEESLKFT